LRPELVESAIKGIQEVKGKQITFLDLKNITSRISDYYLICHGDSFTQVNAIAESIQKQTKEDLNEKPWRVEGKENGQWVLLDYGNLVVHVFYHETRGLYDLENLWADAQTENIADLS